MRLGAIDWERLSLRHGDAGIPAGRPTSTRRLPGSRDESGAGQEPGDYRVAGPHLTGVKLIATPYWCRREWHQVESLLHEANVIRDANWTRDCEGDVGDHAVAPSADLLAEDAQPSSPSASDWAFRNNATVLSPPSGGDWAHLNDEVGVAGGRHESGVVYVAVGAQLEDGPSNAHNVGACTYRNPVQIEAGRSLVRRGWPVARRLVRRLHLLIVRGSGG